jgi:hypothetical protein
MKAAIYARVSTLDQEPENQLQELRRYLQARDWPAVEYVDRGVSGRRTVAPPSISCSPMRGAGGSTCSCAGGSIVSGAT